MKCPSCGSANKDGFKFCMECGAQLPLTAVCPGCGKSNPTDYRFCKECGHALGAPAAPAAQSPEPAPRRLHKAGSQAAMPASQPPPQQPQVVIVKEKRRRRIPAFLWVLSGLLLAVLACSCLLWTGLFRPPEEVLAALPDPLPGIVGAIADQEIPMIGGPAAPQPGGAPPDAPPQPPQPEPPQPEHPEDEPAPPPAAPTPDVCVEDVSSKFAFLEHEFSFAGDFSADVYARFRSYEPFDLDSYDLYVHHSGGSIGPLDCYSSYIDEGEHEGKYEIVVTEPFQYDAGEVRFIFTPNNRGCVIGDEVQERVCKSSEDYHHGWQYNNGCCTRGCWCQQGGEWGCWTTCDSRCAE